MKIIATKNIAGGAEKRSTTAESIMRDGPKCSGVRSSAHFKKTKKVSIFITLRPA